jgi:copper homeostasis protein
MPELLVEAVCCTADECVEAEANGADRIELCSALVVGGLTPSLGTLLEARASTRLPIVSMVRPREGGFRYSARELATMRRDAEVALANGADGIVFGILREDGTVDADRSADLLAIARAASPRAGSRPVQTVFHRAFDSVPEPFVALETLIQLGVTRILTSGREPTAVAGAALLRRLAERAAGRIEILPGGGVREANVAALLRVSGLDAVHLSDRAGLRRLRAAASADPASHQR